MHAMVAIRRIAFHDCLIHIKAESANEAILTSQTQTKYTATMTSYLCIIPIRTNDLFNPNRFHAAMDLLQQPSFDAYRGKRALPAVSEVDADSVKSVADFVRRTSTTDYHPCGTCKMGPASDMMAVVDGEMRVHGLEGVRVVDASVMPRVVSGNLNAPTQMIAERASDFIRGRPQLKPERPRFHFDDD